MITITDKTRNTKKLRNKIYKAALEWYKNNSVEGDAGNPGICNAIDKVLNCDNVYGSSKFELCNIDNIYKEAESKKPLDNIYWFPREDTLPRIKLLEQCIAETE